jgi:hypothetical protein
VSTYLGSTMNKALPCNFRLCAACPNCCHNVHKSHDALH